MKELTAVAAGGLIGVVSRYLLIQVVLNRYEISIPGILMVNLTGCLLIGIAAGIFDSYTANTTRTLFIITGLLGGFTTFSSYTLECMNLLLNKHFFKAFTYILVHNVVGISLTFAGLLLAKKFIPA